MRQVLRLYCTLRQISRSSGSTSVCASPARQQEFLVATPLTWSNAESLWRRGPELSWAYLCAYHFVSQLHTQRTQKKNNCPARHWSNYCFTDPPYPIQASHSSCWWILMNRALNRVFWLLRVGVHRRCEVRLLFDSFILLIYIKWEYSPYITLNFK